MDKLFDNTDPVSDLNNEFFRLIKVHIYEKKYIKSFQQLINTELKYVNGLYIENISEILRRNEFERDEKNSLFDKYQYTWWQRYWKNMPDFIQHEKPPVLTVQIYFKSAESIDNFSKIINQNITEKTKWLHFPERQNDDLPNKLCIAEKDMLPKYPIYIPSKGRWESRLTVKVFEKMGVPYRIVIEPQEYDQYATVIDPKKILVLPFSNLGQGSIPVRNWIWEHSIAEGYDYHWIIDDNIRNFYRLHKTINYRIMCSNVFRVIEDFSERFENLGQVGMEYEMFTKRRVNLPAFRMNTRIYSCILIRNDLSFRWRGRYNEDTDLSLRILKSGLCTVLFYAFNAEKIQTLTMRGGNTEEVYGNTNERLEFAQSLKEQHPQHVKIVRRYNRWHHDVDYSVFKQQLKFKSGIKIPNRINEFGMKLIDKKHENK